MSEQFTDDCQPLYLTKSDENILRLRGFKLIKKLGEGAFAKVFLSVYKSKESLPKVFACKLIDTKLTDHKFKTKFLDRELNILRNCKHPHMIYVHSIFKRDEKYFIFMRYAERGDLFDYLLMNGAIPERQSFPWIRQIALAIQYLHTLEIAHRDLKCENILITNNFNVKLSDFGFVRSTIDLKSVQQLSETFCGSITYVAPEVIKGQPYYPKMADMWSFGVILFMMLNKANPFDCTHLPSLYRDQMDRRWQFRTHIEAQLSDRVKEVIKKLLEPAPILRWTIEQVLTSAWLENTSNAMNIDETRALNAAKSYKKLSLNSKLCDESKDQRQKHKDKQLLSIEIIKEITNNTTFPLVNSKLNKEFENKNS